MLDKFIRLQEINGNTIIVNPDNICYIKSHKEGVVVVFVDGSEKAISNGILGLIP